MKLLLMPITFLLLAGACGDSEVDTSDGGGDPTSLDGSEFWSTSVTVDGVEKALVDGTRIALSFNDGHVGASAGCNSMGGTYSIDGSTLKVAEMSTTEMGCDPALHEQDNFVADLLMSSPEVTQDGDELTLTSGSTVANFLDREVADPDVAIVGARWEVTGFIQGEVAMAIAVDIDGWIEFADDSTMTGFDGCRSFSGSVEVSDGSIGGPLEGDGEVQFGPVEYETGSLDCAEQDEYVKAFTALFATGDARIDVDGSNMTALNRNGHGVTFSSS